MRTHNTADIVIIGAGPVGLDAAIKLKSQISHLDITVLERHQEYKRTQELKLNVKLLKNPPLEEKLWALVKTNEATLVDKEHIEIPIQKLESCLLEHAKKSGVTITYKKFITPQQYAAELKKHQLNNQEALEEKTHEKIIVGIEDIVKEFPDCKLIIGADGAHSTTRELISKDEKSAIQNNELQKLIELTYKVKGKVTKLPPLIYYHTHIYLDGILCTERVKYDEKTQTSNVTLRFIVQDDIYNSKQLQHVNAKNLLPLKESNIPIKLFQTINRWLTIRGDKNIIAGSAMLNKTSLSIYASKNLHQATNHLMLLLVGDAACGFPYMNGLNLGLENSSALAALYAEYYYKLLSNEKHIAEEFFKKYDELIKQTFSKGQHRVQLADKKISTTAKAIKSLHHLSIITLKPFEKLFFKTHPIFESHTLINKPLHDYVLTKSKKAHATKAHLSADLLTSLKAAEYDFPLLYALLNTAYEKNLAIEAKKVQPQFISMMSHLLKTMSFLKPKPHTTETASKIPNELKEEHGKNMGQHFHQVIKNLEVRIKDYEKAYTTRNHNLLHETTILAADSKEPIKIIEDYMGLSYK